MKRSAVGITEVADWPNLTAAVWQASRGKARRGDVAAFRADLDRQLANLRRDLLDGAAASWRREQLRRTPVATCCESV